MLGTNIGIDLGTTSILIFVEGKGIVVSEPSAVAFDTDTGRLLAVGQKAADMIGRNPDSITVVKPMRSGVISDFTATKAIVRVLLYKVCKNMVFKPNIVVCMPSTVTNLEKRTILDLVTAAGAGRACLIEEPLAAALGAGLDIRRPMGTMVVDIGGGTADIAVVTMGSISISKSVKNRRQYPRRGYNPLPAPRAQYSHRRKDRREHKKAHRLRVSARHRACNRHKGQALYNRNADN